LRNSRQESEYGIKYKKEILKNPYSDSALLP